MGLYEAKGLNVNSINIEALDDDHLLFVKNAVEDINTCKKYLTRMVKHISSVWGKMAQEFE